MLPTNAWRTRLRTLPKPPRSTSFAYEQEYHRASFRRFATPPSRSRNHTHLPSSPTVSEISDHEASESDDPSFIGTQNEGFGNKSRKLSTAVIAFVFSFFCTIMHAVFQLFVLSLSTSLQLVDIILLWYMRAIARRLASLLFIVTFALLLVLVVLDLAAPMTATSLTTGLSLLSCDYSAWKTLSAQSVSADASHVPATSELNSLRRDLEALQLLVRTHVAEIPSSELNGLQKDLDASHAQSQRQSVSANAFHITATTELNSLRRDLEALRLLVRTHAAEIPLHAMSSELNGLRKDLDASHAQAQRQSVSANAFHITATTELNSLRRDLEALRLLLRTYAAEIPSHAATSLELNGLWRDLDALQRLHAAEIASQAAQRSEINSLRKDLEALQIFDLRPDYALGSSGASVIPFLTSGTYKLYPSPLPRNFLGHYTGCGVLTGRPPVTALHYNVHNGYCWPFAGSRGQLGIALSGLVYIEAITIDHVAFTDAVGSRTSVPRDMEVWALVKGRDNVAKLETYHAELAPEEHGLAMRNGSSLVSHAGQPPTPGLGDLQYIRIASLQYDIHYSHSSQTFPVDTLIRNLGIDFGVVVLMVESNWGMADYTCLYCVQTLHEGDAFQPKQMLWMHRPNPGVLICFKIAMTVLYSDLSMAGWHPTSGSETILALSQRMPATFPPPPPVFQISSSSDVTCDGVPMIQLSGPTNTWNPERIDFTLPASGQSITRGLGKLSHSKLSALSLLVNELLENCESYSKSVTTSAKPSLLIAQLADSLRRGLSRLSSIPATFERMILGVTNVQRVYLELSGLLQYMTVYVPRIEDPTFRGGLPDADTMGAFTSRPTVVENFHRARLPFWFICPLSAFSGENILRVVEPISATPWMELEALESFPPIIVGPTLQERIHGLHRGTDALPWYKNPFASGDEANPLVMRSSAGKNATGSSSAIAGPSTATARSHSSCKSRSSPYKPSASVVSKSNAQTERNKYEVFDSSYMAPAIPGWAAALAAVDRSEIPICGMYPRNVYVFPEPALLISSEARLDMYLHHYQLIRDALCYRMGDFENPQSPLTISEWRDVLQGKLAKQGKPGTLAEKRTVSIEQELTWELAEMNFRYELCALDVVAAGVDRLDDCMKCFPSPMIINPELSEGKKGFAAITPMERLPFLLSLARLMADWLYQPRPQLATAQGTANWTAEVIRDFKAKVAQHYTRSFYHFFGRAAIIPLRSP
ncbi:hypothetical protein DFH08DRAFT_972294 [Mycena albidolilacea]|uniref:SUN domain-containing protein n=1 Tax=Mycena albidolilacea TaxID=1033008 RepID=A0AAD6ZBM6_9AGAR|nr:hypothetical protein DFH08DRAFT_972294 [Mycena albidolilacea]